MDLEEARWQREEDERELSGQGQIERHIERHGTDGADYEIPVDDKPEDYEIIAVHDPATEADYEKAARKEPVGDEEIVVRKDTAITANYRTDDVQLYGNSFFINAKSIAHAEVAVGGHGVHMQLVLSDDVVKQLLALIKEGGS